MMNWTRFSNPGHRVDERAERLHMARDTARDMLAGLTVGQTLEFGPNGEVTRQRENWYSVDMVRYSGSGEMGHVAEQIALAWIRDEDESWLDRGHYEGYDE